MKQINEALNWINRNPFFSGIMMLVMNIFSKYITISLTPSQKKILEGSVARQILLFSIVWFGTRDIFKAIILTIGFIIMTEYLLNEQSQFCILPDHLKQFEEILDHDEDGEISEKEIQRAIEILEKQKQKEIKRQQLRLRQTMGAF